MPSYEEKLLHPVCIRCRHYYAEHRWCNSASAPHGPLHQCDERSQPCGLIRFSPR